MISVPGLGDPLHSHTFTHSLGSFLESSSLYHLGPDSPPDLSLDFSLGMLASLCLYPSMSWMSPLTGTTEREEGLVLAYSLKGCSPSSQGRHGVRDGRQLVVLHLQSGSGVRL